MNDRLGHMDLTLADDADKLSARRLLLAGVPAFVLSIVASMLIHGYAHAIAHTLLPRESTLQSAAIEELAGPAASFILALLSFAAFVRSPKNLFFSSLAFVSAAGRLPAALVICIRLFFNREAPPVADEGGLLPLLGLHNPTAGLVILCFYSMILLFLCIAVIHESRAVPWKWLMAAAMLAVLIPVQPAVAKILGFPAV